MRASSMQLLYLLVVALLLAAGVYSESSTRAGAPHIIVIIVDDVGWTDVSYHGGLIPTPNIDALSAGGVRLERYYTGTLCTPSRMALLTGRSSHLSGFGSGGVLLGPAPFSLPEGTDTLPRALRRHGYKTAGVGKWHLGSTRMRDIPIGWGFESWVGALHGAGGYYSKAVAGPRGQPVAFYDFGRAYESNKTFVPEVNDEHMTKTLTKEAIAYMRRHAESQKQQEQEGEGGEGGAPLFMYLAYTAAHSPLQVEPEWDERCKHLPNHKRRDYCGLVVGADEGVGNVTAAARQLLGDNVVIVFVSDNGGALQTGGLNFPLRGGKNTGFDGGVRCVGFISDLTRDHRYLPAGKVHNGLVHVSDLMPTLVGIVQSTQQRQDQEHHEQEPPLGYGHNQFRWIASYNDSDSSARDDAVLVLDDSTNFVSYLRPPHKLMVGFLGMDEWTEEPTGLYLSKSPSLLQIVEHHLHDLVDFLMGSRDLSFLWYEILHILIVRVSSSVEGVDFEGAGELLLGSAASGDVLASTKLTRDQINVRVFNVWDDPSERVDLSASHPELTANLVRSFNRHWKDHPRQYDWSLSCPPLQHFLYLPQEQCQARTSDRLPLSQRGASRDIPCRFDYPFVADDDPSPCGGGVQPIDFKLRFVQEVRKQLAQFFAIAFGSITLVVVVFYFAVRFLLRRCRPVKSKSD